MSTSSNTKILANHPYSRESLLDEQVACRNQLLPLF